MSASLRRLAPAPRPHHVKSRICQPWCLAASKRASDAASRRRASASNSRFGVMPTNTFVAAARWASLVEKSLFAIPKACGKTVFEVHDLLISGRTAIDLRLDDQNCVHRSSLHGMDRASLMVTPSIVVVFGRSAPGQPE